MNIQKEFEQMGARVRVRVVGAEEMSSNIPVRRRRWMRDRQPDPIRVNVQHDPYGEFFDVMRQSDVRVEVLDVQRRDRHLVLMASTPQASSDAEQVSQSDVFLCGKDERSWFVAAIPESAGAASVQEAKDALKPQAVWDVMREFGVPMQRRDQRRTAAFVRQGEWFFIPRPAMRMDVQSAVQNEPIRRGAGKPHVCQFLHRTGGEVVYVRSMDIEGVTEREFFKLPRLERQAWDWRRMVRDAHVYVKGTIRHPDHKTVLLMSWHEVVMNTETQARAMQHVAFLD